MLHPGIHHPALLLKALAITLRMKRGMFLAACSHTQRICLQILQELAWCMCGSPLTGPLSGGC